MADMMTFPDTWEEFEKSYGYDDSDEVYPNGSRSIPSFRVKQWLDHIAHLENEQQATVSSDCISRQAAIDAIHEDADWLAAQGSDWQVERMERDKSILKSLPSAQPERKTGHWVEIGDEPYDEWECDMCGFVIDGSGCIDPEEYKDVYKFCPNCGSYNGGEQDEKD